MPTKSNATLKNARTSEIHSFTLILTGDDPTTVANLNALFEAGCDDATFGERDGVYLADFDREGPSFAEALASAIKSVESAVPSLRVVRVEPEELVTASEIAERLHRSRESVRLLFEAKRGNGDFPRPVAWLENKTRLWYWKDVCAWAEPRSEFSAATTGAYEAARSIRTANAFLALRAEAATEDSAAFPLFNTIVSPASSLKRLLRKAL